MKKLGLLILFLSIISCATRYNLKIFQISPENQEEEDYLKEVWSTPLDFTVANKDSEIVWGKIQAFIAKYSSVKIQVATDYVVQTYNTEYGQFGYYVSRNPDVDETTFSIRCITEPEPEDPWDGGFDYSKQAELNAHILAYYALTNEIMTKFIKQ